MVSRRAKGTVDHAVSNDDWMEMHLLTGLCNIEMGKSDHRPICLDTGYLAGVAAPRSRSGRKFEARCLVEETVEEVVKTAWQKAVVQGPCPSAKEKLWYTETCMLGIARY